MKQIATLYMVLFVIWCSTSVDAGYLHGNPHHHAVATSSIYTARTIQSGPAAYATGVYPVNSYQNPGVSSSGGSNGNRGGSGGGNSGGGQGGQGGQGGNHGNYGSLGSYGGFYPSGNGNNGNYGGYGQNLQG